MMKKVPLALQAEYRREMLKTHVPRIEWDGRLKWLRFYLDFCLKYSYPPRDVDSVQPFLFKLAAKGQADEAQRCAAESVALFQSLVRHWGPRDSVLAAHEKARSPWEDCLHKLKEEITLRQYSRKTYQA